MIVLKVIVIILAAPIWMATYPFAMLAEALLCWAIDGRATDNFIDGGRNISCAHRARKLAK